MSALKFLVFFLFLILNSLGCLGEGVLLKENHNILIFEASVDESFEGTPTLEKSFFNIKKSANIHDIKLVGIEKKENKLKGHFRSIKDMNSIDS